MQSNVLYALPKSSTNNGRPPVAAPFGGIDHKLKFAAMEQVTIPRIYAFRLFRHGLSVPIGA